MSVGNPLVDAPRLIHLSVWGEDLVGLGADGTIWEGKWNTCRQDIVWRMLTSPGEASK